MSHRSRPAPRQDRRNIGRAVVKRHDSTQSVGTETFDPAIDDGNDWDMPADDQKIKRILRRGE